MLEKGKVTINGKEYEFLKPYACDIIEIEDSSYGDNFKFNEMVYLKGMLGLVSPELKVDDLVTLNKTPIKLSTGEEIVPKDISFEEFLKRRSEITSVTRNTFAKEMLELCGIEDVQGLQSFKYSDISDLADAYLSLFDRTILDKAVDDITCFCE